MSSNKNEKKELPVVLAITGASGAIYGLRMIQYLVSVKQPLELVLSKAAIRVMQEEHDLKIDASKDALENIFHFLDIDKNCKTVKLHDLHDYGATISSGSYKTRGMVILPCSAGTLGALAHGLSENLVHRAASVCLKERRPLIVVVREMPFGQIQLKNMLALSEAGAIVSCASPGFYHRPRTVMDQIDFVVGRVLDQLDLDNALFKRWKEDSPQFVYE